MGEAFLWGTVGGSSLVVGGVVALRVSLTRRALGLIMAFGAGAGTVSAAFLVAVFLSNLPESIAATTALSRAGRNSTSILRFWVLVAFGFGVTALLGYVVLDAASPRTVAIVLAFAGGAVLTMLANTMMPEALHYGGKLAGFAHDHRVRARVRDQLAAVEPGSVVDTTKPLRSSAPVDRDDLHRLGDSLERDGALVRHRKLRRGAHGRLARHDLTTLGQRSDP